MSMEFVMHTDLDTALPASIEFNFEELKAELAERLDHYNHLVVTEETIKDGKSDRATLNKLRTAIDNRRKDVKKECLKPYNEFESKCKELIALVDQPIAAIDGQLAAYEERRKEEKRQQVEETYDQIVPDTIKEIIPLGAIMATKWLNATTSIKSIEEEMETLVKRTNADMMVLDTVEPEFSVAVREVYIRTRDIERAMSHRNALQAAKVAFEARDTAKVENEPVPAKEEPTVEKVEQPGEKVYQLTLQFQVTKAEANALKEFLTRAGIHYTKL